MSGVPVTDEADQRPAVTAVDTYGWGDTSPQSAGYLNQPVRALVARGSPHDVLDARCGNGALAGELASDGYRVVGVDADREGIAAARRRVPGATFIQSSFNTDPALLGGTPDIKFDVVVGTEVIEHLYSPHELVEFAFAALRPGGRFVFTPPYHGFLKNLALSLANALDRHFSMDWHGVHIKFWSRKTLARLLEAKGFRMIGFRGVGRVPYLWKSMIFIAERPVG